MDQPIQMPKLWQQRGNMQSQKPKITDGTNTFLAGALVVITAAALIAVATDGVLCYGLCPDASVPSTPVSLTLPPAAFFGQYHYPFDLGDGAVLVMNVGTLSGTALVVGEANSAVQASSATVGASYAIATATTGTYAGFQVVDTSDTTNKLFTVVGFPDSTASTDYNGLVLVKMYPGVLQA